MKKTFLARRNALLLNRGVSWGVYALAFPLLALLVRVLAPNFFWYVFTPVFRISDTITSESHSFFTGFSDAEKVALENEKLTAKNIALASENQALQRKIENVSALLGVSDPQKDISGILAGVVARPPMSPYDTLTIAAGEAQGVLLGMEAFGDGGVPIGIVSAVLHDFSRVTLFSAPGAVTGGWVGKRNVPLTITGAGAGVLQSSVERSANVVVGDIVFVPGPGQLPIGSVVRVDTSPLSPGVILRIMPASNPFSIAWVTLRATGIVPVAFATSTRGL
ncbi:MAG: rod shape-determining protein MreC [Minisyncoccia bacterium]